MNYTTFAKTIIALVGGEQNIKTVVHCATRLRFTLIDENRVDRQKIKMQSGILSIVEKGGQFQLVIGNDVDKVYNAIMQEIKPDNRTAASPSVNKTSIINRILAIITGSIAPVIPLLAGAGMGKVLLIVLTMLGWLEKSSQTYYILNFIFDAAFYFMPVFIGFSAAKLFNCNQYNAALVCLAMLSPNWDTLLKAGNPVYFLDIPVALVKYSSQLIPALLTVWVMSYIEKVVNKVVPEMVKVFLAPLLIILLTTPLALIAIGPLANILAQWVAGGVLAIEEHSGFIAIPLLVAIYPWLVSIGLHKALSPISIMLVEQKGFDPVIRVMALCSNMSQAAAALAVSLKTKNKELKQLAFSSSITAFFGGITEPAMYGVNLKLKKPMYACMIGGAIAGLFASLVKLKAFVYVTPGLLSLPMWISDSDNQLVNAIITLIIASIITFFATLVIGFDDPIEASTQDGTPHDNTSTKPSVNTTLMTPVAGHVLPLSQVNDETFSNGIIGAGVAVIPETGLIVAPADGIVTATFTSGHAIGLLLDNGIELLIHIGIDTVKLHGQYFNVKVSKGQIVKQGDRLIECDLEAIKQAGYDPTTIIIITNSHDYLDVIATSEAQVMKNATLLTVL